MVQISGINNFKTVLGIHKDKNNATPLDKVTKKININANLLSDEQKIEVESLKTQLKNSQTTMKSLQDGASFLQDKNKELDDLRDLAAKLKDLSTQYNKDTTSDDDKKNIEAEAQKVVSAINNIIKNDFSEKSAAANDEVDVHLSDGSTLVLKTKYLNLSLDSTSDTKNKNSLKKPSDDIAIEGFLKISDILKDTTNIENSLVKPLEDYHDEISNQLIRIQVDASYEDIAIHSVSKDLLNLGAIDGDEYNRIIKASEKILGDVDNALQAQSNAINKDNVVKLLS